LWFALPKNRAGDYIGYAARRCCDRRPHSVGSIDLFGIVARVASLAVVGMAVGVPSAGAGTANDGFEVEPPVVPIYHLVNKPGHVGSRDNAEVRLGYWPTAGDMAPPAHLHFHVRPGVGGEFAHHNSRFTSRRPWRSATATCSSTPFLCRRTPGNRDR
jgi:hypothetical protein